ncbi:hypothetical protein N6B72_08935 [Chryseobacterium soli]|uniref:hypothetical protein n=1 Tax=Chryseobacterium soli TaxID=445961 RepID=UPI002954AB06|nr:hypothetical protein [Chryseobacterium soli]MDV7697045.1 hypothetical protein [Chryseobacterium soli]
MKKIMLLGILLPYLAFSQKYQNFYYEKITKRDDFIIKIESYDSKSGVYYRINCGPYSAPFEEKIIIPLTKKEKTDLWKQKVEFGDFAFGECTVIEKITVKSNFYFENEKLPPKCIQTQLQKEQFIKLSMKLRLILESKAEYRNTFYWEFIKR